MITAVDTSVLLDVLVNDPTHGPRSLEALRAAVASGPVVACPSVWAEIAAHFARVGRARQVGGVLGASGITFDGFDETTCEIAGAKWHEYRARGGRRTRIVTDFLVGSHALSRRARLLTRDRGFYRRYFDGLSIIDPGGAE